MTNTLFQFLYLLETLIFLTAFLLHLPKKNATLVGVYIAQAVLVSALLLTFGMQEGSVSLAFTAVVTFVVKAIIAPLFFFRLIRKNQFKLTGSTYLSTPLTLLVLLGTTIAAYTVFAPLLVLIAPLRQLSMTAIAAIVISLFLIVNRKGALSQIIGVLSLENAIVTLALFIGLEHTVALELGIQFDILMWIIISSIFVSMVYKQFGTLEVTEMTRLKEE